MKKNITIFALLFLIVSFTSGSMRLGNANYKIYHEKYGAGGVVNSRSIDNRYISAGCEDSPISSFSFSSNKFLVIGYLFPLGSKGLIPLDLLINLVGVNRYNSQLTWSNTNEVPRCDIWICTNEYYTTEPTDWFKLSDNETSPFVDTEASNSYSAFYRLVNTIDNTATSSYDVGKMDIVIESNTVGWISFPFMPQSTCQSINKWFEGRFEARPLSDFNYPTITRQVEIGEVSTSLDYYINDWGDGETNFFNSLDLTNLDYRIAYIVQLPAGHPTVNAVAYGMVPTNSLSTTLPYQTVPWLGYPYPITNNYISTGIANIFYPPTFFSEFDYDSIIRQVTIGSVAGSADYYIDDFGNGNTNFFGSCKTVVPSLGLIIDFSSTRTGTNNWLMINTINK